MDYRSVPSFGGELGENFSSGVTKFAGSGRTRSTKNELASNPNIPAEVAPNLRLKFGMTATEQSVNTCIIVAEVGMDGETILLGALADSVQEVNEMEPGQIEAAPHIGTHLNTDFIKGMGKQDGNFVMILDIDKVFNGEELAGFAEQ